MATPPKNVLLIMADQHRHDIMGCAGHSVVRTPNIDALATEGTRFTNGFCASPLCGPSRAACLTGAYPHTNGHITHNSNRHKSGNVNIPKFKQGIRSLLFDFQKAGMHTHASGYLGISGVSEVEREKKELGITTRSADHDTYTQTVGNEVAKAYSNGNILSEMYEPSYCNVEGEPWPYEEDTLWDRYIADDAIDFLESKGAAQPFYLYVGFHAPHPPWRAPKAFHEMYDPKNIGELPDWKIRYENKPRRLLERHQYYDVRHYTEDMVRKSIAAYYGLVSYMDHHVGRITQKLDELGLAEDTLVIYTSDHGELLYRNGLLEKHTMYEGAIRIPCIFAHPAAIPQGQISDSLVENVDLLPTAMGMLDIPVPDFVQGMDLRPALGGDQIKEQVFAEYYSTLDPTRMVHDGRYKYIYTEEDMCELYDLENDPLERFNLAWYPQYRDRVERMHALVMDGYKVPEVPSWFTWNDLMERKQKQRLKGENIIDARPSAPEWVRQGA